MGDAWERLRAAYDEWERRRSTITLTPEEAYALLAEHEATMRRGAGRRAWKVAARTVVTLSMVTVLTGLTLALQSFLEQL